MTWGGASLELRRPSSGTETTPDEPRQDEPENLEATVDVPPPAPRPTGGPVLFAGVRQGSRATLVAVGTVHRDSVEAPPAGAASAGAVSDFVRSNVAIGGELVLFSEGARVGRLTIDRVGVDDTYCAPRPTASGLVELVTTAARADTFLALPAAAADARPFTPWRELTHNYDQRVASLNFARVALPELGATWPPSVLEARRDIQVFQLPGLPSPTIAATFLYGDSLHVMRPFRGAYSIFLMASQRDSVFDQEYLWYRDVDAEGKGAPRYLDHLDWDGDGVDEVLLDVFGAERRWFAGLARRGDTWVRTFEDRCGDATPAR